MLKPTKFNHNLWEITDNKYISGLERIKGIWENERSQISGLERKGKVERQGQRLHTVQWLLF